MDKLVASTPHTFPELPHIHRVAPARPLQWLSRGWEDFWRQPLASVSYGLLFTIAGYLVSLASWHSPWLVLTFITGFLLIAPFLAIGLYDLSRQHEHGDIASLGHALGAWRRNGLAIAVMALFLALIMVAWTRFTALLVALNFTAVPTTGEAMTRELFTNPAGWQFLALFVISGAILAGLVFMVSAVSWPMLLDRNTDALTAARTSWRAVIRNPGAMLVWAGLIAGLTLLGMLGLYLGLIFTMPLLGHATWHAYRDLVGN